MITKLRFEVRDPQHSMDIQNLVFARGGGWVGIEKEIRSVNAKYLYVRTDNGWITQSDDRITSNTYQNNSHYKESTIEELRDMPPFPDGTGPMESEGLFS